MSIILWKKLEKVSTDKFCFSLNHLRVFPDGARSLADVCQVQISYFLSYNFPMVGSFGLVHRCLRIEEGKDPRSFAMKVMSKRKMKRIRTTVFDPIQDAYVIKTGLDAMFGEIKIWRNLYHRNIVLLFEVIDDLEQDDVVYVLEYMQFGEIMRMNRRTETFRYYKYFFPVAATAAFAAEVTNAPTSGFGSDSDECLCSFHANVRPNSLFSERDEDNSFKSRSLDASCCRGRGQMTEAEASFHYFELLSALEYLHARGICHRDIKPNNLLINDRGMLCIGDFGSAVQFTEQNKAGLVSDTVGTPAYWCPESLRSQSKELRPSASRSSSADCDGDEVEPSRLLYSAYSADLWAASVCLYCFLYGVLPFQKKTLSAQHNIEGPTTVTSTNAPTTTTTSTTATTSATATGNLSDNGVIVESVMSDYCVGKGILVDASVNSDDDMFRFTDVAAGSGARTEPVDPALNWLDTESFLGGCDDSGDDSDVGEDTHFDLNQLFDRICTSDPVFATTVTVETQPIGATGGTAVIYLSVEVLALLKNLLCKRLNARETSIQCIKAYKWLKSSSELYKQRHSDSD